MDFLRLSFVIEFFKDLFFDTKEEANISSSQFNARKFTIFLACLSMLSGGSFLLNTTIRLYKKVNKQETELKALRAGQPYVPLFNCNLLDSYAPLISEPQSNIVIGTPPPTKKTKNGK